jgi:hypothetical protein
MFAFLEREAIFNSCPGSSIVLRQKASIVLRQKVSIWRILFLPNLYQVLDHDTSITPKNIRQSDVKSTTSRRCTRLMDLNFVVTTVKWLGLGEIVRSLIS